MRRRVEGQEPEQGLASVPEMGLECGRVARCVGAQRERWVCEEPEAEPVLAVAAAAVGRGVEAFGRDWRLTRWIARQGVERNEKAEGLAQVRVQVHGLARG